MHRILPFVLILLLLGCRKQETRATVPELRTDTLAFDKHKWKIRNGDTYVYREQMLESLISKENLPELKKHNKNEIIELLGEPDRIENNHFYYKITHDRIGIVTLRNKTMVIKFVGNDSIEWVKIHG